MVVSHISRKTSEMWGTRRLAVGEREPQVPPLRYAPVGIFCHAALDIAACAAFRKESRMKFASATNVDRKSGVA
jgi:hypothetical protein